MNLREKRGRSGAAKRKEVLENLKKARQGGVSRTELHEVSLLTSQHIEISRQCFAS
jgi:hypothetical protein